MGYIRLLRPSRTEDGGYVFEPFDAGEGSGGHLVIGDLNIYEAAISGPRPVNMWPRICGAVTTDNNLLLFHVGIWTFSPVEIGNMKPEGSRCRWRNVSVMWLSAMVTNPIWCQRRKASPTGSTPVRPSGSISGEQKYDKGYYLVSVEDGHVSHSFCATDPRPMFAVVVDLDGASDVHKRPWKVFAGKWPRCRCPAMKLAVP